MKKRIVLTVFLALFCALAYAQSGITVQAPNLVAVDEQFNVTFVIEGENSVSSFNWNPGDDFKVVWGPQKGSSTSISIVNGKRSTSVQTSYTYILMPVRAGSFRLPAATATVKGNEIVSRQISIEVVSDGNAVQQPHQQQEEQHPAEQRTGSVSKEDIFLKLTLSKTSVVLGEPVSASLKLYQRVGVSGFEDARFPSFDGFWSQETYSPSNIEFQRENVGDRIYNTAVLRGWTLIPQRTGDLKIDPAELVCLVNVRSPRSSTGSIFDSFFQDDYQTVRKRVSTPGITVKVSSLPSGAPASFSGGVGSFKMTASLTRDSLNTHDAASLVINVTGRGNVALLEAPKVNFPPDFECYDVKTTENPSGKTFEFPFIPRSHGDFVIGPVEYSYYDISERRYVTLRSGELHLSVARSGVQETSGPAQVVSAPVTRKDVKNLGSDIRYIKTDVPEWHMHHAPFVGSAAFWLVLSFLALAAACVFFVVRKLTVRRADVVGTRTRAASKMARKRLSAAGRYLDEGLQSAFYESLHKALLGFVSEKFNMDMSDITRENIAAKLSSSGIPDNLSTDLVGLLDACDEARYSPSSDADAMRRNYESAVATISSIDDKMKKSRFSIAPILVVLLAAAPALPVSAQTASPDSLWNAGRVCYENGSWENAVKAWSAIVESGVANAELYYNIGNACYKLSDYAGAVLNFERALKQDPSFSDARYNLEYVNSLLTDRIESVPEFFLKTWYRELSWTFRSGVWAVLGILFFAIFLALILLFLLSGRIGVKKACFFSSIPVLVLCILMMSLSFYQKSCSVSDDRAVVMSAVSSVKSAPGDSSVDLFVLHEGTVVTVLETVGNWINVELSDGRQGWMMSGNCTKI